MKSERALDERFQQWRSAEGLSGGGSATRAAYPGLIFGVGMSSGPTVLFLLAALGSLAGAVFGVRPVRSFIYCLAFGVVVCLASAVPLARAASLAVQPPRRCV